MNKEEPHWLTGDGNLSAAGHEPRMGLDIKRKALSCLSRQPYTSRRLADKLREKGYPQQEIEEIIEWCTETGYLNDAEWAARKAEQKAAKGWNKGKIAAYLRHYGILRDDITNALGALETEDYEESC